MTRFASGPRSEYCQYCVLIGQLRLKDNQNAETIKEMTKSNKVEKQQMKSEMNKLSLEIDR